MSLQSQAGEYPNPLLRPTFVEAPVVSGYATVRLRANLQFSGTGTSPSLDDNLMLALIENTGATTASVQFRQVGDYSSGLPADGSGVLADTAPYRSNLSSLLTIVPGGRKTTTFTPRQQYIELWGGTGGPTDVRCQLTTQVPLSLMAFAKGDPTYPAVLWEPPDLDS